MNDRKLLETTLLLFYVFWLQEYGNHNAERKIASLIKLNVDNFSASHHPAVKKILSLIEEMNNAN